MKDVVARQLPATGPVLQERAWQFAEQWNIETFNKGSDRRFKSFRKCPNISFATMFGESVDVFDKVVNDWQEKLLLQIIKNLALEILP